MPVTGAHHHTQDAESLKQIQVSFGLMVHDYYDYPVFPLAIYILLQTRFVVGGLLWPNCCRVLHTPVGKPYGGMLQPHCVSGGSRISGFSA